MHIYVIGTTLSIIFAKLAMNVKPYSALVKSYRMWAVLSFLPLFMISALRYDVGTDYKAIYEEFFYAINSGGAEFKEFGFNLLNKITYCIVDDPALMFAVVSLMTLFFMFMAFYQQSVNPSFSIFVFVIGTFYFNTMNQMRQTLAMAIFLYAMKYIEKRDPIRYFLWILFAFTMHFSAIIYVPIYFLYHFRVNVKLNLMLLAVVVLSTPIMKIIIRVIISLTPYGWYLDSVYGGAGFSLVQFVFNLTILYILYFCYLHGEDVEDKKLNLMLHMHFFAVCFAIYSAAIPQSNRLIISMTVVIPLLVPRALLCIKNMKRRIVIWGIFLFVLILRFIHDIYIQGWFDVLPYQTIFAR